MTTIEAPSRRTRLARARPAMSHAPTNPVPPVMRIRDPRSRSHTISGISSMVVMSSGRSGGPP